MATNSMSLSLRMREEQEEESGGGGEGRQSPLPPAPPPSPECPTHTTDLNQFDFSTLLLNNSKKDQFSLPSSSSSSSQQQPMLSYNHQSPPLSRQESGTTSPSWNESGSFHSHSPFFLPSPEHCGEKQLISDPPSPISYNSMPPNNRGGMLLASTFHEVAHETCPPTNHTLSISLPVNGELQQLGPCPLFGHASRDHTLFGHEDPNGERKRKISLKRSHDQLTQEAWPNHSYENQVYAHNDLGVLHKKLCADNSCNNIRDRESRDYSSTTHSTSPQQRVRSYTHSGVPLTSDFNRLSLAHVGGLGNGIHNMLGIDNSGLQQQSHSLQNHTHHQQPNFSNFSSSYNNHSNMHVGSHVIPQDTRTIGFVTTENHTQDIPMETGDMVGGVTTPSIQTTKISITRTDSVEYNLMDTGYAHNKMFSFSLGSSNNLTTSDNLHPHMGGAYNQATPTSHSPNELFSHSL